ncbi:hypothetical protein EVJ58_g10539, partial [Rhodofomes roseus]
KNRAARESPNARASPVPRTKGSADATDAGQAGEERKGEGDAAAKSEEGKGYANTKKEEEEGREANAQDEHEGSGLTVPAPAGASTNARFVVHAAGHDGHAHTHRDDSKVVPATTHGETADAHVRTSDMSRVLTNASGDGLHVLTEVQAPGCSSAAEHRAAERDVQLAAPNHSDSPTRGTRPPSRSSPATPTSFRTPSPRSGGLSRLEPRIPALNCCHLDNTQTGRAARDIHNARASPAPSDEISRDAANAERMEGDAQRGGNKENAKREEGEGCGAKLWNEHVGSRLEVGVSTNSEFVVRATGHGPRAYTHRDDSGVVPATMRVDTTDAHSCASDVPCTFTATPEGVPTNWPLVAHNADHEDRARVYGDDLMVVPSVLCCGTSNSEVPILIMTARGVASTSSPLLDVHGANNLHSGSHHSQLTADVLHGKQVLRPAAPRDCPSMHPAARVVLSDARARTRDLLAEPAVQLAAPDVPPSSGYVTAKNEEEGREVNGQDEHEGSEPKDHDEHECSEHSEDDPDHQGDQDYETDSVAVEDYYETDSVVVEDYYETGDVVVEDYYESDSGSADDYDDYESEDHDYYSE